MNSVLKSFRLPAILAHFLTNEARQEGVSQAKIVEKALKEMMEANAEWKRDLSILTNDKEYKNEQATLAEEYYED